MLKVVATYFLVLILEFMQNPAVFAQEYQTIPLWDSNVPGALGDTENDIPVLYQYQAETTNKTKTAIIICPGGGYATLAMDHEGHQIARWLAGLGIDAFILRYRIPAHGYPHPIPMEDGMRAIRLVRSHSRQWGIDTNKIGIIGFSAGGHLASTIGTHWDNGDVYATDSVEQVSSRPDFMALVYPVISFTTEYTHQGSKERLLGENPDPETVRLLSNELQVDQNTPPTFLVHTSEDQTVPSENSVLFYLALKKAKVPAELHIFEQGHHGLGLGSQGMPFSNWPELFREWMLAMHFLIP